MGAHESSHRSKRKEVDEALRCFDPEELAKWKKSFGEMIDQGGGSPSKKKHGGGGGGFNEEQLANYTSSVLPPQLRGNLMSAFVKVNQLTTGDHSSSSTTNRQIDWESFIIGISHLIKSGMDERARTLTVLCGRSDGNASKTELIETLKSIFHAYTLAESKSTEFATWQFPSLSSMDQHNESLASYCVSDLKFDGQSNSDTDTIRRWLGSHSVLIKMIELVIYTAFRFDVKRDPEEITYIPWTIPSCDTVDWAKVRTLLTVPSLAVLNSHLPSEYRRQWKLLYSTSLYGESFSTLLKQITMKGPTVMIIRDEKGHVFGGFNSRNWELSANFFGSDSCFLFSLHPTVGIYSATGYNQNYCYLNTHQQTLPNGLGFGGTVELNDQPVHYFALWLDHDFGRGSSRGSSTTFNNPRLSAEADFKVHSIEVWAVEGHMDAFKKAKMAKSILDVDPEARAILEMTGKTRQSEGLRELPPPDDGDFP